MEIRTNIDCAFFGFADYSLVMGRVVEPEILDRLPPEDPAAIRSRRDLCLINKLMGGQKWIVDQLSQMSDIEKVIELGAGDGQLSNMIKSRLGRCEVVALDIIPRPESVRDDVQWKVKSVLDHDEYDEGSVIVANLFIHHLEVDQLNLLGEKLGRVRALFFAEPYRGNVALCMSKVMFPLVNHVTRHDMTVSIKAGFLKGEMVDLIGNDFRWEESYSLFGGIRMKGGRE